MHTTHDHSAPVVEQTSQNQQTEKSVFLEFMHQMKSMQEAQTVFNQELVMSLRQMLPSHHLRVQNPMFQGQSSQQIPLTQNSV